MGLSYTNQQHRPAISGVEDQEARVKGGVRKFTKRATEPTVRLQPPDSCLPRTHPYT